MQRVSLDADALRSVCCTLLLMLVFRYFHRRLYRKPNVHVLNHHFALVFSGEFMPIDSLDGLPGEELHTIATSGLNWLVERRLLNRYFA